MDETNEQKIRDILERELYGYNEGCTGTSCAFSVLGKEKAARLIIDLVNQWIETDQHNRF